MPTVQKFIRKIILAGRDGIATTHAQTVAVLTFLVSLTGTRAPSPSSSVSLKEGYAPTSFGGRVGPLSGLIVAAEGYDTGAAFSSASVHVTTFDVPYEPMRWDIGQPLPVNFSFIGPADRLQMGVDGIYRAVAENAPRDNHWVFSALGQKLRTWLLEGARMNLALASADLANNLGLWGINTAVTFDVATAPSCIEGQTAIRLTSKGGGTSQNFSQNVGTFSGNVCVASLIVERVDTVRTTFGIYDGTANAHLVLVEYRWDTDVLTKAAGTDAAAIFNREKLPGGRVRISVAGTGTIGNQRRLMIYPHGVPPNTNTVIVHHVQLEDGFNIPSSPIVTPAAAVTRPAEKVVVSWPFAPRSMTIWTDLVDFGTALQSSQGVWWELGATSTPRLLLYGAVPAGRLYYAIPDATRQVNSGSALQRNEHVLYRAFINEDNSFGIGKVAEGASESVIDSDTAFAFPEAWSAPQLFIGGFDMNTGVRPQTITSFRSLRARWGAHDLLTMQDRRYTGLGLYVWKAGMAAPAPNALASDVRTYIDSNGALQLGGANEARAADYSTGQRGMLVESKRTNLVPNSAGKVADATAAEGTSPPTISSVADPSPFGGTSWQITFAAGTPTGYSSSRVRMGFYSQQRDLTPYYPTLWVRGDFTGVTLNVTGSNGQANLFPTGRTIGAWAEYTTLFVQKLTGGGVGSEFIVCFLGLVPAADKTVHIAVCQVEVGTFRSSLIIGAPAPVTRAADAVIALQVMPAGIHATRYEKYYDLATQTVVERVVDVPSTTGDAVFADGDMGIIDRVWYALAYDAGVKTLAEMQALVASV